MLPKFLIFQSHTVFTG